MKKTNCSIIGFVFGAAFLVALSGCVGPGDGPRHESRYAPPPPNYVEGGVVVLQDDYVYYPGYQVYYSSNRRQYVYQDGRSWVTRPAPARVSVDVLFASPSVRLDFHDAPSVHHATVVKQYPKQWKPPGSSPNKGKGNQDNGKGNDRGDHK